MGLTRFIAFLRYATFPHPNTPTPMKNTLYNYLVKRIGTYAESSVYPQLEQGGYIITIARDYGAEANPIGEKLLASLEHLPTPALHERPWVIINKEVLEQLAHELKIDPDFINAFKTSEERSFLESVFASFSKEHNVLDAKLKQRLTEVIASFSQKYNLIIIGRGGIGTTKDYPHSLHIKLMAPLAFRAKNIAKRKGIALDKAMELATEIDHHRDMLVKRLLGRPYDNTIFDLILNRSTLSEDCIVEAIINTIKYK